MRRRGGQASPYLPEGWRGRCDAWAGSLREGDKLLATGDCLYFGPATLSVTVNCVPFPGLLSTSIVPPCWSMMVWQM